MSTYKEIAGTDIEVLSSDPANPVDGQVWYNSTSNTVKANFINPGSWATGGNINTARNSTQGSGVVSSAVIFGGNSPAGAPAQILTETYNGTSWTEVNDLNTGRLQFSSAGTTQDAALAIGGFGNLTETETWNGTSWTEVNDLNAGREYTASAGTQTAALIFGGSPPPDETAATESWNGTSWTEVNDLNTARRQIGGAGTNTAALAFGGENPGAASLAITESWNGTSWTEVGDLNTARTTSGGAGITNTSALCTGGGSTNLTESWNGTSWTELSNMTLSRLGSTGSFGTQTSALIGGGYASGFIAATEEWTAGPQTITFSDS